MLDRKRLRAVVEFSQRMNRWSQDTKEGPAQRERLKESNERRNEMNFSWWWEERGKAGVFIYCRISECMLVVNCTKGQKGHQCWGRTCLQHPRQPLCLIYMMDKMLHWETEATEALLVLQTGAWNCRLSGGKASKGWHNDRAWKWQGPEPITTPQFPFKQNWVSVSPCLTY